MGKMELTRRATEKEKIVMVVLPPGAAPGSWEGPPCRALVAKFFLDALEPSQEVDPLTTKLALLIFKGSGLSLRWATLLLFPTCPPAVFYMKTPEQRTNQEATGPLQQSNSQCSRFSLPVKKTISHSFRL